MRLCTVCVVFLLASGAAAQTPVTSATSFQGTLPADISPAWNKGILPINQENYWNAVACGKQGGARPLCVFYDAEVCKNDDYELSMFTPYKMVAYEVWRAVRAKQEAPTPSYAEAQRTRITVKVVPKPAAKNPVTAVVVKRGAQTIKPPTQSLEAGGGSFIFDFAAFAPGSAVSIDMVGRARTVSCVIEPAVLTRMR